MRIFFALLVLFSLSKCIGQDFELQPELDSGYIGLGHQILVTDVDGDNLDDISFLSYSRDGAFGYYGHDTIGWFKNLGSGNYSDLNVITNHGLRFRKHQYADLTGDGINDLIYFTADDDLFLWAEGLGNGDFGPETEFVTDNHYPNNFTCTDFDFDGDIDILFSRDQHIMWYENIGSGQFSFAYLASELSLDNTLAFEDFDMDGDIDVVFAADDSSTQIYSLENTGMTFGNEELITEVSGIWPIEIIDFDFDGDLDIVCSHVFPEALHWLENVGNLYFFNHNLDVEIGISVMETMTIADYDQDQDMDIIAGDYLLDKVIYFENDGSNNFAEGVPILEGVGHYFLMKSADLDNDGDTDFATFLEGGFSWFKNKIGEGCTNPNACNYNANAYEDDASCCLSDCGCTNPLATNFNPTAQCSIPVCTFKIGGTVFHDENGNGEFDSEEIPLAGRMVFIESLGIEVYTNNQGVYEINIPEGTFSVEAEIDEFFPFDTTPNPVVVNTQFADDYTINFGLSNELPEQDSHAGIAGPNAFLCDEYITQTFFVTNHGNVPLDGNAHITISTYYQEFTTITSNPEVSGNSVSYEFEGLLPGQTQFFLIELRTPTADFIGVDAVNSMDVTLAYQGEEVAFESVNKVNEVLCSYDPNDKQVEPLGFTSDHLILNGTEQEFLVRFQNTGNAPAINVEIQDSIDINYDLESFRILSSSHSMMTTINSESRQVSFLFEDIQLPDSASFPILSQGFVSYAVTPFDNLPDGTVLHNTAEIYFDNNEPIVTNTTWAEIHECNEEGLFEYELISSNCQEEEYLLHSLNPLIDSYQWYYNNEYFSFEEQAYLSLTEEGDHQIYFTGSHELCSETEGNIILISDLADNDLVCIGDMNCDLSVTLSDLVEFLAEFGCSSDCKSDFNSDGYSNAADLTLFLVMFGNSCE